MAKFSGTKFLDASLDYLSNHATKVLLLNTYVFGDSYTTLQANTLASSVISPSDFIKSDGPNHQRQVTFGASSTVTTTATAASSSTPFYHYAFIDENIQDILHVIAAVGLIDQIAIGDGIVFPEIVYVSDQPI